MKRLILALCILGLASASCKKKDDKDGCDITQASVAGTYKVSSLKYGGVEFYPASFEACELDDEIVLNADGTYSYNDVGVTCDGDATGTWNITGNKMSFDLYTSSELTVDSYDCTTLKASGSEGGVPVSIAITKK